MPISHSANHNVRAGVKGGLIFGDKQGLLVNGNLTSLAAAVAAVKTANRALHTSQRTFGPRVIASLESVNNYDSTYLAGTDVDKATMLAISNAEAGRSLRF